MVDESIFKAYDIRGVYPDTLDEDVARDIGRAFVSQLSLSGSRVVVARDMRLSGEALEKAFIEGVTEAGADVLDLGMISTDALYFAVGHLEEPGGAMVTASHNPKDYNGFKLCREDAIALSGDEGIGQIRDLITSGKVPGPAEHPGSVEEGDITEDYAEHCLSFIDTDGLRPLKIVVDAGNGMAGKMVPPVFEGLPFEYVPMYFELDGSFPNHAPSPIEPRERGGPPEAGSLRGRGLRGRLRRGRRPVLHHRREGRDDLRRPARCARRQERARKGAARDHPL